MQIDEISAIVVDEAIAIHRELGPGLFETVYEVVLAGRLETRGLKVERQVAIPCCLMDIPLRLLFASTFSLKAV